LAVDQFSHRDRLEPASKPAALLVEPEFDDRLRDFGKDVLDDFIGIIGRKSATPRDSEKKWTIQTIEFGPARRVRQIADPLDQGGLRAERTRQVVIRLRHGCNMVAIRLTACLATQ
jgi:hypothetical protein